MRTNDERRTPNDEPGTVSDILSSSVLGRSSYSRADLDLVGIIRGRHSVRRYHERRVPRELIEQVLEAARWAPSPHGRLPWRFAVLTRPEPKQRLAGKTRRRSSYGGANRTSASYAHRRSSCHACI